MTGRWTRLLTAALPAIEGHTVNLGTGSADVTSLAEQAQSLITEDPQPQPVLLPNAERRHPMSRWPKRFRRLAPILHEAAELKRRGGVAAARAVMVGRDGGPKGRTVLRCRSGWAPVPAGSGPRVVG